MTILSKLLNAVNSVISRALAMVGIPASANTLHQYEKAIFGHDPKVTLAKVCNKYLDVTKPSVYKNMIAMGTGVMTHALGIRIDAFDIRRALNLVIKDEPIGVKPGKGRRPKPFKKTYNTDFKVWMETHGAPFDKSLPSYRESQYEKYGYENQKKANPTFKHHHVPRKLVPWAK